MLLKDKKEIFDGKSYYDPEWDDRIKICVLPKLVNIPHARIPKCFF